MTTRDLNQAHELSGDASSAQNGTTPNAHGDGPSNLQGERKSNLRDVGAAMCVALAATVFGSGCASSRQQAAPDTASNQILGKGIWEPQKSPLQLKRAEIGHGIYVNELGQASGFMNPTVPIENLRADFRMANGEIVKTDLHLFGGWISDVRSQMSQAGQVSVIVDLNGNVHSIHPEQQLKIAKVAPCPRRNG